MNKTIICKECNRLIIAPKKSNKIYCDNCSKLRKKRNDLSSKQILRRNEKEVKRYKMIKEEISKSIEKIKDAKKEEEIFQKFNSSWYKHYIPEPLYPLGSNPLIRMNMERDKLRGLLDLEKNKDSIKELNQPSS